MDELTLEEASRISVGDLVYFDDGYRTGYNEVLGIDEVYSLPFELVEELKLKSSTAWLQTDTGKVIGYSEHSENEWGFIELPKEVINKSKLVNRLFWIKGYDGGHSLLYYEVHTDPKFIENLTGEIDD